jgi:hypothetical protein
MRSERTPGGALLMKQIGRYQNSDKSGKESHKVRGDQTEQNKHSIES